jgi:hypothetical protein
VAVVATCLLAILGGVTVVALKQPGDITQKLGAVVLIIQGHPEAVNDIDQGTAVGKALTFMEIGDLANARTPVSGYRLTSANHAFGLTKATTKDGRSTASWGEPKDVWVLEFAAPPEHRWTHVSAFVIVDARSGKIDSYSETQNN